LPVASRIAALVFLMSSRSSATFCMFFCEKPWPMNSQWRALAARTIAP